MQKFTLVLLIALCVACNTNAPTTPAPAPKPVALAPSKNSAELNEWIGAVLKDYYDLKEGFVKESDTAITASATMLQKDINSGIETPTRLDSTFIETNMAAKEQINGHLTALLKGKTLEEKKKVFYTLSEKVYDLVKAIGYDRATVYHQHCPMAFNNAGGNWLSDSAEIRNPYYGKKMLDCGEVIDSLDLRKVVSK